MSAVTRTASPTTALAGYRPVGVRGRMSSMTIRPITCSALPPGGRAPNRLVVVCTQNRDGLAAPSGARAPPSPPRPGRRRGFASLRGDEGAPQLHGARQAARAADAAPPAGDKPEVVVGRADPGSVQVGRSRPLGAHRA